MEPLDPAVLRVWRVLGALPGILLAIPALVVLLVARGHLVGWIIAGVAAVALAIGAVVVPTVRFRYVRWGVRDGVLLLRDGVLWRREAAVPLFRVQHVDLEQGPVQRWARVQKLVVRTASADADITVPGLAAARAGDVRTELVELAREAVAHYGIGEASDAV